MDIDQTSYERLAIILNVLVQSNRKDRNILGHPVFTLGCCYQFKHFDHNIILWS